MCVNGLFFAFGGIIVSDSANKLNPPTDNVAEPIRSVRGMKDVLVTATAHWQFVEVIIKQVVTSYGYQEIRLPVVERAALFSRSIGEVTDIVEKEMYTFTDRNGDILACAQKAPLVACAPLFSMA